MSKVLHIFRGLPGSGKSTAAKLLAESCGVPYWEADMKMFDEAGKYAWTQERLSAAIEWVREKVFDALCYGQETVIVTGVAPRYRAMRDYIEYAGKNGYKVIVHEMVGRFQNTHDVSEELWNKMAKNFIPIEQMPKHDHVTYERIDPKPHS